MYSRWRGSTPMTMHMTDLQTGRRTLDEFKGFVACGGFSYGDVLGAGAGWAKSILLNAGAARAVQEFFNEDDSFALSASATVARCSRRWRRSSPAPSTSTEVRP